MRRLGPISTWLRMTGRVSLLLAWACAPSAASADADADPASALLTRHAALSEQLEHTFPQHLHVESVDGPGASQGEVYAVVDYPIATVSEAFSSARKTGATALILHLNVKHCRPVSRDGRTMLSTAIGRNFDQPLSSAYRVEFTFGIAASRPDYVDVELKARKGPLGTANYRISLEAVGLESERAFVHLRYSYTYGLVGRLAMMIYPMWSSFC